MTGVHASFLFGLGATLALALGAIADSDSCSSKGTCSVLDMPDPVASPQEGGEEVDRAFAARADSLKDSEEMRQITLVNALQCIERLYGPIMKNAGHKEAGSRLKDAVAEALALTAAESWQGEVQAGAGWSLDEATTNLWESYQRWFCAVSRREDCTVDGHSFDDVRSTVVLAPFHLEDREEEPTVEGGNESNVINGEPQQGESWPCTWTERVSFVEEIHRLQQGTLTSLAKELQTLQELQQGVDSVETLRILAELITEQSKVKDKAPLDDDPKRKHDDALVESLAQVMVSHTKLLLALGENATAVRDEIMQSKAEHLQGRGACANITSESFPEMKTLAKACIKLIQPYMRLHCAAHANCAETYTKVVGGKADYGNSLLQHLKGAAKAGGLILLKGTVAVIMSVTEVQRFGAEVFAARSTSSSVFDVSAGARLGAQGSELRQIVRVLLLQKDVEGVRHLIRIASDLLVPCSASSLS